MSFNLVIPLLGTKIKLFPFQESETEQLYALICVALYIWDILNSLMFPLPALRGAQPLLLET